MSSTRAFIRVMWPHDVAELEIAPLCAGCGEHPTLLVAPIRSSQWFGTIVTGITVSVDSLCTLCGCEIDAEDIEVAVSEALELR